MKIKDYRIARGNNEFQLVEKVHSFIQKGFQPHGSLSVVVLPEEYTEDIEYTQPMVRYEDQ